MGVNASNPTLTADMEIIIIAHKTSPKIQHAGKSTIFIFNTWQIRPEMSSYNKHPASLRRLIRLYTYQGDTILDPFCGSGTTPFIAKMERRNYIGIDISPKYC